MWRAEISPGREPRTRRFGLVVLAIHGRPVDPPRVRPLIETEADSKCRKFKRVSALGVGRKREESMSPC